MACKIQNLYKRNHIGRRAQLVEDIVSEGEFKDDFLDPLFEFFKSQALETFKDNPRLVTDVLSLHDYIHIYVEEFKELKWLKKACSSLAASIFLATVGLLSEAYFALRHGLEIVDKNTKEKHGLRLSEEEAWLYDKVFSLLSNVVHGSTPSLVEFRDLAVVTTHLYLSMMAKWNPNLPDILLKRGFEEDEEFAKWIGTEVDRISEKWHKQQP
jgi:hypothetical protein